MRGRSHAPKRGIEHSRGGLARTCVWNLAEEACRIVLEARHCASAAVRGHVANPRAVASGSTCHLLFVYCDLDWIAANQRSGAPRARSSAHRGRWELQQGGVGWGRLGMLVVEAHYWHRLGRVALYCGIGNVSFLDL